MAAWVAGLLVLSLESRAYVCIFLRAMKSTIAIKNDVLSGRILAAIAPVLLAFAIAGCGNGKAAEPELPPEVAGYAKDLQSEYVAVRLSAVKSLVSVEQREAVDVLTQALSDVSPRVRRWAVWALGHKTQDDIRATIAIIETLKDDDANVRCAATTALGEVADEKVVGHIANRMADPHPAVRLTASALLAQHTDEMYLKQQEARIITLAMRLLDEPNLTLSRNAVLILNRISEKGYGAKLDWLAATVSQRRQVVKRWKAWHER